MSITAWTYIWVILTFSIYIGIAFWTRVRSTAGFYVAGNDVPPLRDRAPSEPAADAARQRHALQGTAGARDALDVDWGRGGAVVGVVVVLGTAAFSFR
jgi:hypothetical protein